MSNYEPRDPKRINLEMRLELDRIEARSEQDYKEGLVPTQVLFDETARSHLVDIALSRQNPERYEEMVLARVEQWHESWNALAKLNPPQLDVALSVNALKFKQLPVGRFESGLMQDDFGGSVLGLEVIIESPIVKKDFWKAFVITSASQVFYTVEKQSSETSRTKNLRESARLANDSGKPQAIERLLILPDKRTLVSIEDFNEAIKDMLAIKVDSEFANRTKLSWESSGKFWRDAWNQSRIRCIAFGCVYGLALGASKLIDIKNALLPSKRHIVELLRTKELEQTCPILCMASNRALLDDLVSMDVYAGEAISRHFLNIDEDR